MPLLSGFDPPAFLNDFDQIPGQRKGWGKYISHLFDNNIAAVEQVVGAGKSQFYNETKTAPAAIEKTIFWNAFPRTLVRRFGRMQALQLADQLQPDSRIGNRLSRIQDEYCEWRVTRDPDTGKIIRVFFTCEGPEYWQSIAGGPSIYANPDAGERSPADFGAEGDKQLLLRLYREILGNEDVQLEDLFFPDSPDVYNPWNKWNTTDGIVHLQQINNTLSAEINIGAQATILRRKGGELVTDATQLICCAGYGGAERASDPKLGSDTNSLARDGHLLTLRNPVGIYLEGLNDSGWTKPGPNGTRVTAGHYWKPLRPQPTTGGANLVVRAVYEVPPGELGPDGRQLTVSDIQIGGAPITFGGQIAEHITMKFIALASQETGHTTTPVDCRNKCCAQNGVLRVMELDDSCADVFPAGISPMMSLSETPIPRVPHARNLEMD